MPIYEYECRQCGHRLETIQSSSDPHLIDCPVCHEPQLKRLLSAAAFRLKGGGWYETDFKGSDRKRNVAESSSECAGCSGGGEGGASKGEAAGAGKKAGAEKAAPAACPAKGAASTG